MTDLDQWLVGARAMSTDACFDGMEAAVLRGLAVRRERTVARRGLMLAGIMAIGIGWVSSLVPGMSAHAAPIPIGMSDYAPSRLLGQ